MGETATMADAGGGDDLALLLAEAAAGIDGAGDRLAARLRTELSALLDERLNDARPATVAEAGQLVRRHWRRLAGTHGSEEGTSEARAGRNDGKSVGKGAGRRTKRPQAPAEKWGTGPVEADAGAREAGQPLFRSHAEAAATVMEQLVQSRVARDEPQGPTARGLEALARLDQIEAPLARIARLRWFAGLDDDSLSGLLDESVPEVRRRWTKARAFLTAAQGA